jgi:DNA-binding XRE family transcriptional regulator
MSELSENLKTIRLQWRRTQADMGDIFEVTRPVYQSYESGRNEPDIWFIFKMEKLTGLSARRLCMERIERLDVPDQPIFRDEQLPQVAELGVDYQKRSRSITDLWAFLEQIEQRLVFLEGKVK